MGYLICCISDNAYSMSKSLGDSAQISMEKRCRALELREWASNEKWVWNEICEGREADFNVKEGRHLLPDMDQDWSDVRVLSPKFLELLVTQQLYVEAMNYRGVRIRGAWFKEPIQLSDAVISRPLALTNCRFGADVNLSLVKSSHGISFAGSGFYGSAIMPRLQVAGSLRLNEGAFFKNNVHLSGAIIDDVLSLDRVRVYGLLDLNSVRVGTNVFMHEKSTFQDVSLKAAQIGGELYMAEASFSGLLSMDGLQSRGSVFMSDGASFASVKLRGAQINGQLLMNDSVFTEQLNMEGLRVGDAVLLNRAQIKTVKQVDLSFARIDSNLDLSGSNIPSLNLTGTQIKGEFRLGSNTDNSVKWLKGAKLTLRNTQVSVLQDRTDAWPEQLELDGFTYIRLGGMGGPDEASPMQREIRWFNSWLTRQQPYSPQPYEHLSSVFKSAGHEQKAVQILFESKERERNEIAAGLDWFWLTLLKYFIGYGYKTISGVCWWILIFTSMGTVMLKIANSNLSAIFDNRKSVLPSWLYDYIPRGLSHSIDEYLPLIIYSFDRFLPILRLRPHYYATIELDGWVMYYFYLHQFMGFFLASLLIASLTGLTSK